MLDKITSQTYVPEPGEMLMFSVPGFVIKIDLLIGDYTYSLATTIGSLKEAERTWPDRVVNLYSLAAPVDYVSQLNAEVHEAHYKHQLNTANYAAACNRQDKCEADRLLWASIRSELEYNKALANFYAKHLEIYRYQTNLYRVCAQVSFMLTGPLVIIPEMLEAGIIQLKELR